MECGAAQRDASGRCGGTVDIGLGTRVQGVASPWGGVGWVEEFASFSSVVNVVPIYLPEIIMYILLLPLWQEKSGSLQSASSVLM